MWHRLWPWPKGHAGRVWPRCANDTETFLKLKECLPLLFLTVSSSTVPIAHKHLKYRGTGFGLGQKATRGAFGHAVRTRLGLTH
ncbi:MAG: hypothetical protein F6J98_20330 [Moorea sp. SIO4G2]|uniref:hypothetical protein n=1 Tax=Moorena sp. SIO3E8 TaxID=2607830 RepID=UPI0013FB9BA3|nr:hypothetical protein [Moorena sp. SIO3E8]NEO62653.1 hypothetical protein [Moorena sp. SIO4G2]